MALALQLFVCQYPKPQYNNDHKTCWLNQTLTETGTKIICNFHISLTRSNVAGWNQINFFWNNMFSLLLCEKIYYKAWDRRQYFTLIGAYKTDYSGRFLPEARGLATLVLLIRSIVLWSMPILGNETWLIWYCISRQVSFLCPVTAQTQLLLLAVLPHLEFT